MTIPTNRTALSNNATTVLRMRHYPTEHVEQKQIEKSPWGDGKANRVEFTPWLRRRDRDGVGGRGGQRLGNVRSWSDV